MRQPRKPSPFSDEEIIAAAFAVTAGAETTQSRIQISDIQRYLLASGDGQNMTYRRPKDRENIVSGTKISKVLRNHPEYFGYEPTGRYGKVSYYYVRPWIVAKRIQRMAKRCAAEHKQQTTEDNNQETKQ